MHFTEKVAKTQTIIIRRATTDRTSTYSFIVFPFFTEKRTRESCNDDGGSNGPGAKRIILKRLIGKRDLAN